MIRGSRSGRPMRASMALMLPARSSRESISVPSRSKMKPRTPAPTPRHPHRFERTGETVGHANRHFFKLIAHVEDLIHGNPAAAKGGTRTWEKVKNGLDRKLTITATTNADGSVTYDFELD